MFLITAFSLLRISETPAKLAADVLLSDILGSTATLTRGFSALDKLLSTNSSSNFFRLIDLIELRLLLCKSLPAVKI